MGSTGMTYVLSEEGLAMLARLAFRETIIGLDFDGSLAPIVEDRDRAAMRRPTRELLVHVCELYPCAVISGRARADVERHVVGAGFRHIVGNHGIEPCQGMDAFAVPVLQAFEHMTQALDGREDLDLEWKRYSFAVHYRRARDQDAAEREIRAAIDTIPCAMKVIPGKLVLNLVPAGAPNKGDAMRHLKTIEEAECALYIGDDVTDEDVFQLRRTGEVIGVRVGQAAGSRAAYYLHDQDEVDRLLETLVELREGTTSN
jgi:trehalose 6-phosphate phosphatase